MDRTGAVLLVVGTTILLSLFFAVSAPSSSSADCDDQKCSPTLDEIIDGRLKIVDLTHTLNSRTPYWPGENYQPFELKTIATLEEDGVLSKVISMPEHLGTHIDAPNHFEAGQPSVDEIAPQRLFARGVLIDVAPQAEQDADYRLSLEDVNRWEHRHGRIPENAVVLLRTGWGRFWDNYDRFKNQDVRGRMHFPSFSAEAARFLIEQRGVRGIGVDTLSIDYGLSQDFAVHHIVNGAGRYGLENLARLEELPPLGFYLVIAPIKIETGTGGPTRILALIPDEHRHSSSTASSSENS